MRLDDSALLVCLLNLALIGALPRIFFRHGRLNLRWWLTASPFFVAGAGLLGGWADLIAPLVDPGPAAAVGLTASIASIALIGFTAGTHRAPPALWHQRENTPSRLVTSGAYRRVRHPFYLAFLLALTGAACVFPHWLTIGSLVFAAIQLHRTAVAEERELLRSEYAAVYAEYVARTGRLFPRVGLRPLTGVGERSYLGPVAKGATGSDSIP
jgi:protein-S-isoprenylcysteine O-methyltransferase Ste14